MAYFLASRATEELRDDPVEDHQVFVKKGSPTFDRQAFGQKRREDEFPTLHSKI